MKDLSIAKKKFVTNFKNSFWKVGSLLCELSTCRLLTVSMFYRTRKGIRTRMVGAHFVVLRLVSTLTVIPIPHYEIVVLINEKHLF